MADESEIGGIAFGELQPMDPVDGDLEGFTMLVGLYFSCSSQGKTQIGTLRPHSRPGEFQFFPWYFVTHVMISTFVGPTMHPGVHLSVAILTAFQRALLYRLLGAQTKRGLSGNL